MKAELKTKQNDESIETFLETIENEQMKKDCLDLVKIMENVTQLHAKMWGANMIGLGVYEYKYASGREGEYFCVGFSPRKKNISIYFPKNGISEPQVQLLKDLGKHKLSGTCLHINSLQDIKTDILEKMITNAML
jgi:hypothetical protein